MKNLKKNLIKISMDDFKYIYVSISVYFTAFFITGVYYLVVANNWDYKWINAILFSGDVYTKTSCSTTNGHTSCNNQYYVEEMFYKTYNTTNSCTVRRLTPYTFKGDANAFVSRMKLGTTRQLYQTTYSVGTCFDDKIREQYNIYGGVFLGLSMIPILVIFYIICVYFIKKFQQYYNEYILSNSLNHDELVDNCNETEIPL
jgi:hypothetical protein